MFGLIVYHICKQCDCVLYWFQPYCGRMGRGLEISDNYRVPPTQDFGPSQGAIVSASGSHVTKAVTVAEILKKRHCVSDGVSVPRLVVIVFICRNLRQDTQIKYIR